MTITNSIELKKAIEELTHKSENEREILRSYFNEVVKSLKPINLLKSTLKDIEDTPHIASTAIGTTLAIGAGVLAKKLIVGSSSNIFKKIVGRVIEFAVAKGIASNSMFIANKGIKLLKKLSADKEK